MMQKVVVRKVRYDRMFFVLNVAGMMLFLVSNLLAKLNFIGW